MYSIPVSIPNSFVSASASVRCRDNASRLISSTNILPNNSIAPSSAPWLLHRCWSRTRLPWYVIGRDLGEAAGARLYGFESCLLFVLSLRRTPTRRLDDIGSLPILAPPTLIFAPLGPAPELGATPEAVRLACGNLAGEESSLVTSGTVALGGIGRTIGPDPLLADRPGSWIWYVPVVCMGEVYCGC